MHEGDETDGNQGLGTARRTVAGVGDRPIRMSAQAGVGSATGAGGHDLAEAATANVTPFNHLMCR
jgi:hypothetical protein